MGLPESYDLAQAAASNSGADAFVQRRSVEPEGQERIESVIGLVKEPLFSLHSGTDRGATWYDRDDQIVWLVGFAAGHDYSHFEGLARADRLLPRTDDYDKFEALEFADTRFLQVLGEDADRLIAAARSRPREPVPGILGGRVRTRVCYEPGDPALFEVAIGMDLLPGGPRVPAEWQLLIANAFFPDTPWSDFDFADAIDATPVETDELALRYLIEA